MKQDERDLIIGRNIRQLREAKQRVGFLMAKAWTWADEMRACANMLEAVVEDKAELEVLQELVRWKPPVDIDSWLKEIEAARKEVERLDKYNEMMAGS